MPAAVGHGAESGVVAPRGDEKIAPSSECASGPRPRAAPSLLCPEPP